MRQQMRRARADAPQVYDSRLLDKAVTAVGWAIGLGLAALLLALALWGPR